MTTLTEKMDRPFINGEWCEPHNTKLLNNFNPATEEVVDVIKLAGIQEAKTAIAAAKTAFKTWGLTSGAERAIYLHKIASILTRDKQKLSELSTKINGKPLFESAFDLDDAIACFEYYAQQAIALDAKQEQAVPLAMDDVQSYVRYEPSGVVCLITPWNFPLVTSSWKLAPALAAGCTVILKPAEAVTRIELEWGRIFQEVGLPNGVVNILPGLGTDIGNYLCEHPDIDKVSFTGGNVTGVKVSQAASQTVKNLSLELGGKSPILVFDAVDIDATVDAVIQGIFFNCGQMCSATSRLLIEESIAENFKQKLLESIQKLIVGSGTKDNVNIGPMTTEQQYRTVERYFHIAKQENLDCVVGGSLLNTQGWFIEPTVYWNVPVSSKLWTEEIFGPVLCARTFTDEDEAIRLANDSEFGLAATVCSQDKDQLRRVSKLLRAGHIWWNMPQVVPVETSWGGFGKSGTGRELGQYGLNAFLEIKHVDYLA